MVQEFTTIDDMLNVVLRKLSRLPFNIQTSRGVTSEITGALLTLTNPRARLSSTETKGTPFSALGELLWYLSRNKNLDFIEYYIKAYKKESQDGKTIHGGYGPRLFNFRGEINQVQNVINRLETKPNSRKAVIQLFDASDLHENHLEIPCTCNLQFLIRDNKLNMYTSMRSNDAFLGLSHDIFAFTMIQEIIARSLKIDMGWYKHAVCSLHLYEDKIKRTKEYLSEGYQPTKGQSMPKMPIGEPWLAISQLLKIEEQIRNGQIIDDIEEVNLSPYWQNLASLLQIHSYFKTNQLSEIEQFSSRMRETSYYPYIVKRLNKRRN